ncbi:MAG: hypothetical protein C4548_09490 [Desulfobacteraceae bacterium]|jgi:hypothetical protein|nr:MAG: hypothetical protein C4548_09490 [Desulfobacteraceae bacterium]
MKISWPENKQFAFTIFDDTDVSTLGNITPVYELLAGLGFRTTKSVWPLSANDPASDYFGSHTLEDGKYCDYIKSLQQRGFEIAYHGARMESSSRNMVQKSLQKFRTELGVYPRAYACHAGNCENLYWGEARFTIKAFKLLFQLLNQSKIRYSEGHRPESRFFWGDLAKKYINYARSFSYDEINLFNISPRVCYADSRKPFLNYLFISSDADNVEEFNNLIHLKNQEKLERQGGVCILSTHLGKGFIKEDAVNPATKYLLERLSQRNGWFPTVSQLLDYLTGTCRETEIDFTQRINLELKWFLHSFKRKLTARTYEKSELDYLFPDE